MTLLKRRKDNQERDLGVRVGGSDFSVNRCNVGVRINSSWFRGYCTFHFSVEPRLIFF